MRMGLMMTADRSRQLGCRGPSRGPGLSFGPGHPRRIPALLLGTPPLDGRGGIPRPLTTTLMAAGRHGLVGLMQPN